MTILGKVRRMALEANRLSHWDFTVLEGFRISPRRRNIAQPSEVRLVSLRPTAFTVVAARGAARGRSK